LSSKYLNELSSGKSSHSQLCRKAFLTANLDNYSNKILFINSASSSSTIEVTLNYRCQICFDGFYHEEELHLHIQTEHETMEIQEINPLEILEVECDVVVNEDDPV
jgi:hypothetical protein